MQPDFYTGKKLYLAVLAIFIAFSCVANTPSNPNKGAKNNPDTSNSDDVSSVNLKLSPSFFWSTLGAEIEYKLSSTYTISLNTFYKFGRTAGQSTYLMANHEAHLRNGLRAEIAMRYFPDHEAPKGLYYQAHIGIGNIIYEEGSNRPFTINSPKRKDSNTRELMTSGEPQPFSGGIGIGYQFILPSRKLIANLNGGVQTNFSASYRPYLSLFFSPSVGIIF